MAVLFRRNFKNIELLRVDSNPNGVAALGGSLATLSTNGAVYKNVGGTTWQLVTEASPLTMAPVISSTGGGAQGAQGAPGAVGLQGLQGYQGIQGIDGSAGSQGAQGDPGAGPQGNAGAQGLQGGQGNAGAQGAQGGIGSQGDTGRGAQGHQGFVGAQGADAAPGAQGFTGVVGAQGNPGEDGVAGSQGPQGGRGPQGSTGTNPTGATGAQGTQGNSGADGIGSQGAQGPTGAQGAAGVAGADGAQGTQGSPGSGLTGPQGVQGVNSIVAGPAGPQGLQGSQGPQGSTGLGGAQGYFVPGAQGSQGPQGSTGLGGAQGLQGNVGGSAGSALVLVQSQTVSGAAVQSVTFSGLNGDSDRFYLLKIKLKKGTSSNTSYYLRPNSVTTNLSSQMFAVYRANDGTGGQSNGPDSTIYIGGTSWASGTWDFNAYISAEKTVPRLFNIRHDKWANNGTGAGQTQLAMSSITGRWNETTTNMTSLQIYASVASGIAVGSEFHLYKIIV
jgi:hypothetical protein